jgi:hypothetical protein
MRPCLGAGLNTHSGAPKQPPPTPRVVYFSMINLDHFSMLIDKLLIAGGSADGLVGDRHG